MRKTTPIIIKPTATLQMPYTRNAPTTIEVNTLKMVSAHGVAVVVAVVAVVTASARGADVVMAKPGVDVVMASAHGADVVMAKPGADVVMASARGVDVVMAKPGVDAAVAVVATNNGRTLLRVTIAKLRKKSSSLS